MHYPELATVFEARLQTHTDAYPHAVEYHRARFNQTITKYYPISEHLNYISFPPALERKAFISKHLGYLKEKSQFCDLGFGPGVLTAFILQQNTSWRVEGVDVSQHCLQHAQRLLTKKERLERYVISTCHRRHTLKRRKCLLPHCRRNVL